MTHEEYKAFVKMYDGLKAITKGFKKLSRKNQFVVDFACLMATKEAIKEHDSDDAGKWQK